MNIKKFAAGATVGAATAAALAMAIPALAVTVQTATVIQSQVNVHGPMLGVGASVQGQGGVQPGGPIYHVGPQGIGGPGPRMMGSSTYGTSSNPWMMHGTSTRAYPEIKPSVVNGNAIFGTVVSISGNIITVSGPGNKPMMATTTSPKTATYTVDATNATVIDSDGTSTLASVAVGDHVMVEGMINANLVVATIIRDGVVAKDGGYGDENASSTWGSSTPSHGGGFFASIGNFFRNIFHF